MPPFALEPLAEGNVVELRVYGKASNQQIINRWFAYLKTDTGVPDYFTDVLLPDFRAKYRLAALPNLPDYFSVVQYWAGRITNVTLKVGPPPRYEPTYDQEIVLLAADVDVGTGGALGWLPLTDTVTMQRFGNVRNKFFRSAVHYGPVKETNQDDGVITDAFDTDLVTKWNTQFIGGMAPIASYNTRAYNCLFSYALGVGLTTATMWNATTDIAGWVPNKLLGTQRSRKIRAQGY